MSLSLSNASAKISPSSSASRWWVLHTHPRAEKVVATALTERGIEFFLPLITARHSYAKSKVAFQKPLFPGYVFLLGDEHSRELALRTNKLVQVISVPDQARLESELAGIRRALASDVPLELFPAIRVGARCRVLRGPLLGLEGVVERVGTSTRIYLSVSALGQSVVVEIDAALLERVD